jgi:hypothetical protein
MIRKTRKETKFLDKLIRDSFDANHITCHFGCACREEAMRRMVRTLLLVDDIITKEVGCGGKEGWGKTIRDRITKSLEEE